MDVIKTSRTSLASIDRRVGVLVGSEEQRASLVRVSDLRSLPFVVLLGEPGIGKSTVFDMEAGHEGVPVLKVRGLIAGARAAADVTLFLDALDEYRTDGQSADKVHELAHAMAAVKTPRWRLSCRSEDWRKEADIAPIQQQTTDGVPIVVAQLLPLDQVEAAAVLGALGENDPKGFLAKAEAFSAGGFLESPLSLKLLYKAVSGGGDWPRTRFHLFASAITSLAYERSYERKFTERHSPEKIIATAANICLLLLVSGARAIWRSNDEPPTNSSDMRAFLTVHDLGLDHNLLRDVLDTALFRGEGESFEPMHRTVAEHLAARALAGTVVGANGHSAIPLSRAIALITGVDGGPPTELRGLYAWFAAHLAKLDDDAGAKQLIERDAATVLAYGDAAVFATSSRQAILTNLARKDPYFRASEVGVTAVGGLAGEDLAANFAAVLTQPSDDTHRLLTVLEVLTSGRPVLSIRPLLRSMALDPARPVWQRQRAADAWLNGLDDPTSDCRTLFDALAGETVSTARESLRANLAAALPASALSVADIKSILADFQRCPEDNTVGRLFRLQRTLEADPRPELFDEPIATWLPNDTERRHSVEIESMIHHMLTASICGTADLTAARLWRWTINVRDRVSSGLPDESATALTDWLDGAPGRDVAFFDAILADDDATTGPWMPGNIYIYTTGRRPSAAIIRHVLGKATTSPTKAAAKRLLAFAVEMARHPNVDIGAYWETHDRVTKQPGCKRLLRQLTVSKIKPWRHKQHRYAVKQRRREAKHKAGNIKVLAPVLAKLRVGGWPGHLEWAAKLYFRSGDNRGDRPDGIESVAYFTDEATTDAILAGWEYLATKELVGVDATLLGTAEAEGRRYDVELAAIAGLDRLFEEDRLPNPTTIPITLAIAALKSSSVIGDQKRRKRLEKWAIDRLNLEPSAGAAELLDFWRAALASGASQISSLWRLSEDDAQGGATTQALGTLLETHRSMPPEALRSAVRAAGKHLDPARFLDLAEAALGDTTVAGEQRTIWSFVAFYLDPVSHGDRFIAEHSGEEKEVGGLFGESFSGGLIESLDKFNDRTITYREEVIVRFLGPVCSPEDSWHSGNAGRNNSLSNAVSGAIDWLSAQSHRDAGTALAGLTEVPNLAGWLPILRHAQAQHQSLRRDRDFKHPMPSTVWAAIAGGPPVNASDLRAIVTEELNRLRAELRTSDTTPWKRYWNVDSNGKVTKPLIENECRDHLLDRLRDRLKPYRIAAAVPEARRGEGTRADILMLTGAGRNLPVEAKRHYNRDIWVAASTQLQGYAADEGADGFGIYLVFWFGNDAVPTPSRPTGENGPMTATELETMLKGGLSPDLLARTDVIVFDVSNPKAPATAKPRKKRKSQA